LQVNDEVFWNNQNEEGNHSNDQVVEENEMNEREDSVRYFNRNTFGFLMPVYFNLVRFLILCSIFSPG